MGAEMWQFAGIAAVGVGVVALLDHARVPAAQDRRGYAALQPVEERRAGPMARLGLGSPTTSAEAIRDDLEYLLRRLDLGYVGDAGQRYELGARDAVA